MSADTALQVAFAAAVVVATGTLAAAALGRAARSALYGLAALTVAGSIAAWVVFALGPTRSLGVSAGGLTVCALAVAVAIAVQRAVARSHRVDAGVEATGRDYDVTAGGNFEGTNILHCPRDLDVAAAMARVPLAGTTWVPGVGA